jgi:hypothetical protein
MVMVVVMITLNERADIYANANCHAGAVADEGADALLITVVVW